MPLVEFVLVTTATHRVLAAQIVLVVCQWAGTWILGLGLPRYQNHLLLVLLKDFESHVQILQLSISFDEDADLDRGIVGIEDVLVVALYLAALVVPLQVGGVLLLIL